MENGVMELYLLPAKCLCSFHKACEQTGAPEIMALNHTIDPYFEACMDTPRTSNVGNFAELVGSLKGAFCTGYIQFHPEAIQPGTDTA